MSNYTKQEVYSQTLLSQALATTTLICGVANLCTIPNRSCQLNTIITPLMLSFMT